MATYQGHKSRAHWNVALWFGNEETLYRLAIETLRENGASATRAAPAMLAILRSMGETQTPDGTRYTLETVRAALAGLKELA